MNDAPSPAAPAPDPARLLAAARGFSAAFWGLALTVLLLADVVRLFASAEEKPFRQVVLAEVQPGCDLVGFLTREDCRDLGAADRVAVYLPMSYQLGGFTVLVPRSKIRVVDMSVEDALRFCVTAGVAKGGQDA